MIDRPLLTVNEVAELLQISRTTIYELLRTGQLRSRRVASRHRFLPEDLEAYLRRDEPQQTGA